MSTFQKNRPTFQNGVPYAPPCTCHSLWCKFFSPHYPGLGARGFHTSYTVSTDGRAIRSIEGNRLIDRYLPKSQSSYRGVRTMRLTTQIVTTPNPSRETCNPCRRCAVLAGAEIGEAPAAHPQQPGTATRKIQAAAAEVTFLKDPQIYFVRRSYLRVGSQTHATPFQRAGDEG